jgi:hypothetical protein
MSRNLGALTSWNPKGVSRPVMRLLLIIIIIIIIIISSITTKSLIVQSNTLCGEDITPFFLR